MDSPITEEASWLAKVLSPKLISLRQKLGEKAKREPKLIWFTCACLEREPPGKPDAGNPQVRFDEGEAPPSLLYRLCGF